MKKILGAIVALFAFASVAYADSVLVIDAQYSTVTQNVKGRLEAAGHTVTVTTDVSLIPTSKSTYQQVWDLRYSAALTSTEQTNYQSFITNGGFAYFVTENPGCCMARNNSVAALVTALGGGSTQIGPGWANNVETNMNTKYMTNGITVNYAAVAAIVNSQGIPLIQDSSGAVSGMSWIGRAGALGSGVTGTIVTVADTNWLDQSRFVVGGTTAQQQNVQALDDIIKGIVAGTVGGTITANGNGAAASNGAAQQQNQAPTVVSSAPGTPTVSTSTSNGTTTTTSTSTRGTTTETISSVYGATTTTVSNRDAAVKNNSNITVTRTTTTVNSTPRTTTITDTTPITTVTTNVTPRTTTTTTTPVTVDTYSDGSTVSTNGTPVVTTSTTNVTTSSTTTANEVIVTTVRDTVVQSSSADQSQSVSATGGKNAIALRNFNLFMINPLNQKDGAWLAPYSSYAKANGSYKTGGTAGGYQWTVDNNTFGVAVQYSGFNSGNMVGSSVDGNNVSGNAYGLIRDSDYWLKLSIGAATGENKVATSIPTFSLYNNSKFRQNNYYADIAFYTPNAYEGFRPLIGATVNASQIGNTSEAGSPLLSTTPDKGTTKQFNPYVGVRYEFDKDIGLEGRVTHNADFKTVAGVKATVNKEIFDGVFLNGGLGFDKGSNYQAVIGTVGVKVAF